MLSLVAQSVSAIQPTYPHAYLSYQVIGAAIEVHKSMGSGFLEKVYETALSIELSDRGISFVQQAPLVVKYKGRPAGYFQADFLVEDKLVCELKAVDALTDAHEAQVLNYLRATGLELGLLINFGEAKIRIRRLIQTK